jgi:hypothetical protein
LLLRELFDVPEYHALATSAIQDVQGQQFVAHGWGSTAKIGRKSEKCVAYVARTAAPFLW